MKPEEQIKALAELDGIKICESFACGCNRTLEKLNYLTSYDAIIPLIQKQNVPTITRISLNLSMAQNGTAKAFAWLKATPSQLCEALLRATGKWKE